MMPESYKKITLQLALKGYKVFSATDINDSSYAKICAIEDFDEETSEIIYETGDYAGHYRYFTDGHKSQRDARLRVVEMWIAKTGWTDDTSQ